MSSPILDMGNINMRLGPSNMGRCGNGRGVHSGGVTMHPLTVLHPIRNPDFGARKALLARDTFFVFLHNRPLSPDWSGWLQHCEDIDRGMCFMSSDRIKVRTCCSSTMGKEQWAWEPGVWEFWLVRGGNLPLTDGLDSRQLDESISSFINHVRRWDKQAHCSPLSDPSPPVIATGN